MPPSKSPSLLLLNFLLLFSTTTTAITVPFYYWTRPISTGICVYTTPTEFSELTCHAENDPRFPWGGCLINAYDLTLFCCVPGRQCYHLPRSCHTLSPDARQDCGGGCCDTRQEECVQQDDDGEEVCEALVNNPIMARDPESWQEVEAQTVGVDLKGFTRPVTSTTSSTTVRETTTTTRTRTTTTETSSPTPPQEMEDAVTEKSKLGVGVIVGIVVGVLALLFASIGLMFYRRRQRRNNAGEGEGQIAEAPYMNTVTTGTRDPFFGPGGMDYYGAGGAVEVQGWRTIQEMGQGRQVPVEMEGTGVGKAELEAGVVKEVEVVETGRENYGNL